MGIGNNREVKEDEETRGREITLLKRKKMTGKAVRRKAGTEIKMQKE
jgi:hypothetical protein